MSDKKNIVIIGNGIAGTTCARHIRKRSKDNITIISSESPYFFSRTALMYVYMGHMKFEHLKPYEDWFWQKNNLSLIHKPVVRVDTKLKFLELADGDIHRFDILIIATGSKTKKYNWPGQDLSGVTGLYSLQDLEAVEEYTKNIDHAVIVGGGLIGVELAEMLHSRHIPVTFLVRENKFWDGVLPAAEAEMIGKHIVGHGVHLHFNTELQEIISDEKGRVKEVLTKAGETINCGFVGITTGVEPNIDFLADSDIETDKGILVDKHFETTVPGIFAIGDCAEFISPVKNRKPVEQVWYTARIHGETLAQTLTGNRTAYQPGPWFNSAKFFDIEYQTYGDVPVQLKDGQQQFVWKHPDKEILLRLVWDGNTGKLQGINAFGMRLRHEVFDKWLSDGETVDYIVDHLKEANFDPEFFEKNEKQIRNSFLAQQNKNEIQLTA